MHTDKHKTAKCPKCGAVWCLDEKDCGAWTENGKANTEQIRECEFCRK